MIYAPIKEGGFNMVNIKNFFQALRINWIRRYIHGLDDHWADMLDEQLKCDINSRDKLLKLGAEHPSINKIINLKLPCLSSFFEAYNRVNNIFCGDKNAYDNRWSNGSICYSPSILRMRGHRKKGHSPKICWFQVNMD